jgi:hypothetical protein
VGGLPDNRDVGDGHSLDAVFDDDGPDGATDLTGDAHAADRCAAFQTLL